MFSLRKLLPSLLFFKKLSDFFIDIVKHLKGKIIKFVKINSEKRNNELLEKLEKIEDKEYKNVAEISQETGLAC